MVRGRRASSFFFVALIIFRIGEAKVQNQAALSPTQPVLITMRMCVFAMEGNDITPTNVSSADRSRLVNEQTNMIIRLSTRYDHRGYRSIEGRQSNDPG
jgi:hypothetical protein